MKNKKLLILLAILSIVVVAVVVFLAVFSLKQVRIMIHDFEGNSVMYTEGAPSENHVMKYAGGKNIIFLDKQQLLDSLNADKDLAGWHAFAVVKYPDSIDVHFVQRVPFAKVDIGGDMVYVDFVGYVTQDPAVDNGKYLDISSAFSAASLTASKEVGKPLTFQDENNNARLQCILNSLHALWQCYVEVEDFTQILGNNNVFTFEESGNLVITTKVGAKIIVQSPQENLTKRLQSAFAVYYNPDKNLQTAGVEIIVNKHGDIINK